MSFEIIGTGRGLPEQIIENQRMAEFLDTSDEWIVSRTGIRSRRVCRTETATDLAVTAAEQAMKKAGVLPAELDLILCSTIGGDYVTPSLACCVAGRIGATCPSMDLNAGCVGFLYSLSMAAAHFDSGRAEKILVIGLERMSSWVDWNHRSICVLFGDGAGAAVLGKGDSLRYLHLGTEGDPTPLNRPISIGNNPFTDRPPVPEVLHMDGRRVFKFATRVLEAEITRAFKQTGFSSEDIDLFLIHQANGRIVDYVREKLGQPEEKFPKNVMRYGNTSSASIPILLDELLEEGAVKPGQTLFLSAFGAGLTYGSAILNWK
ncbi:MAG: ketoacyl-ACP synthase III [Clostridiales bacterium]|nr:ketoacyl-ACP synthase III [Clostridiales bacterium]